jgi:uncharacterized membrane protein YeaQ/YmgE (transglycosylase-associated protein family)
MWLLVVLVFGGIVGWVASYILKSSPRNRVLANVALGVVGAGIGNWLGGVIGLGAFGTLGRFLVALVGSVALITALNVLASHRR